MCGFWETAFCGVEAYIVSRRCCIHGGFGTGAWIRCGMGRMKKILLGTIALIALGAAPASAADLAARHYTKAPSMVAAVYDWTGFYIGANGGGGWGRDRISQAAGAINVDPSGGFAGGQVGYNWQRGAWVLGVEADGDWADINGNSACGVGFVCSSKTDALASFRGRVGYAVDNILFYGTGGAGYASTRNSVLSAAAGTPVAGATGLHSSDRWGYAAGAGIEWGFSPNWTAKVEYMHYGLGSETAPAGTLDVVPTSSRLDVDTVKVGVNYRWGGPPIAKY